MPVNIPQEIIRRFANSNYHRSIIQQFANIDGVEFILPSQHIVIDEDEIVEAIGRYPTGELLILAGDGSMSVFRPTFEIAEPFTDTDPSEYDKTLDYMKKVREIIENKEFERLRSMKDELNPKDFSTLHYAAKRGSLEMVIWLLAMNFTEQFPGAIVDIAINSDRNDTVEHIRIIKWLLANTPLYPFNKLSTEAISEALVDCKRQYVVELVNSMVILDKALIMELAIPNKNTFMIEWLLNFGNYVPSGLDYTDALQHFGENHPILQLMKDSLPQQ